MNRLATILLAGVLLSACHDALAETLHVATQGNDANPGTQEQPFVTPERARDEIRRRSSSGLLPVGGITVELRGGTYILQRPLELTAQDSGSADAPIVYRASPGETVKLVGGCAVTGWNPVTDTAVLERLDEPARGQVWQASTFAQVIRWPGELTKHENRRVLITVTDVEVFAITRGTDEVFALGLA